MIITRYYFLGVLIPQNIESIVQMETDAEFIVVVEKDTIFQKLLDENFRQHLPISFILITVKLIPLHCVFESLRCFFLGKRVPRLQRSPFPQQTLRSPKDPSFHLSRRESVRNRHHADLQSGKSGKTHFTLFY